MKSSSDLPPGPPQPTVTALPQVTSVNVDAADDAHTTSVPPVVSAPQGNDTISIVAAAPPADDVDNSIIPPVVAAADDIIGVPPVATAVVLADDDDRTDNIVPPVAAADAEVKTPDVEKLSVQPLVTTKSHPHIHPIAFDGDEDEGIEFRFLTDMFSPFNPFSCFKSPSSSPPLATNRVLTEDASLGLESLPLSIDMDQLLAPCAQFQPDDGKDENVVGVDSKNDDDNNEHVPDAHEELVSVAQLVSEQKDGDKEKANINIADVQASLEDNAEGAADFKEQLSKRNDDADVEEKETGTEARSIRGNGTIIVPELKSSIPARSGESENAALDYPAKDDNDNSYNGTITIINTAAKAGVSGTTEEGCKEQVILPPVDGITVADLKSAGYAKRNMNMDAKIDEIVLPPFKRWKAASISVKSIKEEPQLSPSPVEKSLSLLIQSEPDTDMAKSKGKSKNEIKNLCNVVDHIIGCTEEKKADSSGRSNGKGTAFMKKKASDNSASGAGIPENLNGNGSNGMGKGCKDAAQNKDATKGVGIDLNYTFVKDKNLHSKSLFGGANNNGDFNNGVANKTARAAGNSLPSKQAALDDDDGNSSPNDVNINNITNFAPPKTLFSSNDGEGSNSGAATKCKRVIPPPYNLRSNVLKNTYVENCCNTSGFLKHWDPLEGTCAAQSHVLQNFNFNNTKGNLSKPNSNSNTNMGTDMVSNLGSSKYFADFYENSIFKRNPIPQPKKAVKKETANANNNNNSNNTWNVFSDEEGTKVRVPNTYSGRYFGGTPTEPSLLFKKHTPICTQGTVAAPPRGFGGMSRRYFETSPPTARPPLLSRSYKVGNGNSGSGVQEKWFLDFHPKGGPPINKSNHRHPRQVPRHNVNYSYIISQARDMLARVEKCEKEFQDTYSKKIQEEKNSHKNFLNAKKQMLKAKCVTRQWTTFRKNVHDLKDDIRQFLASFY